MARALPSRLFSSRRRVLQTAGAATLALASPPALADAIVKLPLPGGPDERPITTAFPEKGALILLRTRPPGLHAERPVLRPLALGGHPHRDHCSPQSATGDW